MPIYEYLCQACGETSEVLRKVSDPPLELCPLCGEAALKKKVSAAAFRLKGGGWYETDFKTSNKKNLVEGSDAKAGGGKSAEAGGGDSGGKAAQKGSGDGGSEKKADSAGSKKSSDNSSAA